MMNKWKKGKRAILAAIIAAIGLSLFANPSPAKAMDFGSLRHSLNNMRLVPAQYRFLSWDVITVAKSGGEYTTINQALQAAHDSLGHPVTILVMPGTYVESVKLIGRHINLVGANRDKTIVKTFTNDYHNPPVDLSVNSNLYNLTVFADGDAKTPPGGVGGLRTYAVHFDMAGRGYSMFNPLYQGKSIIKDCKLISMYNSAAGIGLTNNQELVLENNILDAHRTSSLYAHSYIGAGARNQKLLVKNNTISIAVPSPAVIIQDANWYTTGARDTKDTVFTFINNNAYSAGVEKFSITGYAPLAPGAISGFITLGPDSTGNNIPALNR